MADAKITALAAHTVLIDTDVLPIVDITASATKKTAWSTIKSVLKTYFDTLYAGVLGADDNYVTDAEKAALHAQNASNSSSATSAQGTTADAALPRAGGAMTGNITLGENVSIALDPAGSADGKYSGITVTGTAGATLAFGDLIYLAVGDSRWELTDSDSTTTAGTPMIGMCVLAAAADGDPTTILLMGIIRADAKFPTLTIGAPAYVGETPGLIQVAIPVGADNVIRIVGRAMTADELYFCPSQDHQISVA